MNLGKLASFMTETNQAFVDYSNLFTMYQDIKNDLNKLVFNEWLGYEWLGYDLSKNLMIDNGAVRLIPIEEYKEWKKRIPVFVEYFEKKNFLLIWYEIHAFEEEGVVDVLNTFELQGRPQTVKEIFSNIHLLAWAKGFNDVYDEWENYDNHSWFDLLLALKGDIPYEVLYEDDLGDSDFDFELGALERNFEVCQTFNFDSLRFFSHLIQRANESHHFFFHEVQEALQEVTFYKEGRYHLKESFTQTVKEEMENDYNILKEISDFMIS